MRADVSDAINWYEDEQAGLGAAFWEDLRSHYRILPRDAQLYAIRFADVRRLNLDRFPYGLFYVIRVPEVWLLAVLHGSRDTEKVLAERRKYFEK